MAGSQVAWLGFDPEQQQRTRLLLAALSEQGTIDELGMGILRDLISGMLFPGHTVLHTRAKYLLFVPRDFANLPGTTAEAIELAARKVESKRINALVSQHQPNPGLQGIIGYTTGSETKQLPSGNYWGLLRRLGIYRAKGSARDYYANLAAERSSRLSRSRFHAESEGTAVESASGAWAELPEEDKTYVGFALSLDEAAWLRERFVRAESSAPDSRSLVTWLLEDDRDCWFDELDNIWDHPLVNEFPVRTAAVMWLGRDADQLVYGARILYNYLCAIGRPDSGEKKDSLVAKYETAMAEWLDELDSLPNSARLNELNHWAIERLHEIRATLAAQRRWASTFKFLRKWLADVERDSDLLDDAAAHTTIIERERRLKPGRARLTQTDRLRNWEGDSGYFRMDYNWEPARRLLDDIHLGLGTRRLAVEPPSSQGAQDAAS